MKKFIVIIICGIMILGLTGCGKEDKRDGYNKVSEDRKSLVLYFSATGTTEGVAKKISYATLSDIIEIVPKEKYTKEDLNYNNDGSRANREMNDKDARPEIENDISVNQYETIYIGYPIWWGTNPRIILTLFDTVNFEGKDVILFCTSGSSGIEESINDLKEYNSNVNFLGGKRFTSNVTKEEVNEWLANFK